MRRTSRWTLAAVTVVLIALAVPAAQAAGGSSKPKTDEPKGSPQEQALELYNKALSMNDRSRQLAAKASGAPDGDRKTRTLAKADEGFEEAIPLLREAVELNPGMFQAHSELGYAYRKTGKYDKSLEAYNKALALDPHYAPAVEYRAEAYLGLNRVDEAKQAYDMLKQDDAEYAGQLLAAMRKWLDERRENPGDVTSKTLNELEQWIEQNDQASGERIGHNVPTQTRDW